MSPKREKHLIKAVYCEVQLLFVMFSTKEKTSIVFSNFKPAAKTNSRKI